MHPDIQYCSLPLFSLLHFQGRGPTCSSCLAADWLAAALHEGWVKGQGGLHNPAQPGNHLFQMLFFGDCSHVLSPRPPVTSQHPSQKLSTSVKFNTLTFCLDYCQMLLPLSYKLPYIVWTLCTKIASNTYTPPPCTVQWGLISPRLYNVRRDLLFHYINWFLYI